MVYSVVCTPDIKYPSKKAIFKLGFKKWFKENFHLLKPKCFFILDNADNILVAFKQTLFNCLSNFDSLSKI